MAEDIFLIVRHVLFANLLCVNPFCLYVVLGRGDRIWEILEMWSVVIDEKLWIKFFMNFSRHICIRGKHTGFFSSQLWHWVGFINISQSILISQFCKVNMIMMIILRVVSLYSSFPLSRFVTQRACDIKSCHCVCKCFHMFNLDVNTILGNPHTCCWPLFRHVSVCSI